MGAQATLEQFIDWARTDYPADKYALVLWNHGDGWRGPAEPPHPFTKGICDDSTDGDQLEMAELHAALHNATQGGSEPIHVVVMDACLMGGLEVAFEVKDYSQYFTGSAELVPGDGNKYQHILDPAHLSDTTTPASWADYLVTAYQNRYDGWNDHQSYMAAQLSEIDNLSTRVSGLATLLLDNLSAEYEHIQTAWTDSRHYTDDPNPLYASVYQSFIDLHDFCHNLRALSSNPAIQNQCLLIMATVANDMLLDWWADSAYAGTTANQRCVWIYFPPSTSEAGWNDYNGTFLTFLESSDQHWDEFLEDYFSFTPTHALSDDTPETFSDIPKDFSFEVRDHDWCAVGIYPTTDHDIKVDDDDDFSSPYASSTYTGTTRDFVVTNGHEWGDATHYAQVYYGSPSDYVIEAEWEANDLGIGSPESDSIAVGEVIQIYEVDLSAGVDYEITVDITSGSADLALFAFEAGRSYGRRFDADWHADSPGGGGDEEVTFTAPVSGDYGIVVVNENNASANYVIFVQIIDTCDLTMQASPPGGGSTTPPEGTHTYDCGTWVDISANPNACYEFDHWIGGVEDPSSPSTRVYMDGDKTVTAVFVEIQYDLTIQVSPPGGGSTTPPEGTHTYDCGIWVDILAAPNACYEFDHWVGDVENPSSPSTRVYMDEDKTVTAHFNAMPNPEIVSWEVAAMHGASEIVLPLQDNDIEPRACVSELRITFDQLMDPGTVNPGAVSVVGSAAGEQSVCDAFLDGGGTVMVIELCDTFPDIDWYTVTVAETVTSSNGCPLDGDRDLLFGVLIGDVNGDALVSNGDLIQIRIRRGEAVTEENAIYDVNCDGIISNGDLIQTRIRRGNELP